MESLAELIYSANLPKAGRFIEDEDEAYDAEGFRALALEARDAFRSMGVKEGDRILFAAPNSVRLAAALMGGLLAGAVICPVHPDNGKSRLKFFIDNTGAVATAVDGPCQDKVYASTKLKAVFRLDRFEVRGKARKRRGKNENGTHGLGAVLHTSGSTGVPNGVRVGHSQALFAVKAISQVLSISREDVIYAGLPFSFDYGLFQLFMALHTGARLVIRKDFSLPLAIPRDLHETGATIFPAVPSLIATLLKSRLFGRIKLPWLRLVTSTGDALPRLHWERLTSELPGTEVVRMYGLTECKRVSIMPPGEGKDRPDSVGLPLPGTKAWVEKRRGVPAAAGEVGELLVSGPHVNDGYWMAPEATGKRFWQSEEGHWVLRTGDLFRADEEGYLYFVARKGRMIKTGAQAVSPLEIENLLAGLHSVGEAAVVSIPDEERGSVVCAALAVGANHDLDEEKVRRICAENLAPACVPAHVKFFQGKLPKTENGKIHRKVIRSHFARE